MAELNSDQITLLAWDMLHDAVEQSAGYSDKTEYWVVNNFRFVHTVFVFK
jgi:hypothetical protein